MSTQRYTEPKARLGFLSYTDISQGDLGHTDLQEDLEFHSSSTRAIKLDRYKTDLTYSRFRRSSEPQQNPTGHLFVLPQ
jgi:hypothetical protein